MKKNIDISEELEKELCKLKPEEFWKYVSTWIDVEEIMEQIREWDEDIQEGALEDIMELKKTKFKNFKWKC